MDFEYFVKMIGLKKDEIVVDNKPKDWFTIEDGNHTWIKQPVLTD